MCVVLLVAAISIAKVPGVTGDGSALVVLFKGERHVEGSEPGCWMCCKQACRPTFVHRDIAPDLVTASWSRQDHTDIVGAGDCEGMVWTLLGA